MPRNRPPLIAAPLLARRCSRASYVNFLGDEGPDRVRAAYGPASHDRLVVLKRAYDPDNFCA